MRSLNRREIVPAIVGQILGDWTVEAITGVSTDARSVQPGDLFFALKGERFDGHDFVADALAKGAAGAVVARVPEGLSSDAPLICVADSLIAYGDLAAFYRSLFDLPVVAITGSVGKTTAKEMTAGVLETRFRVLRTEANFNNEIGLPKTLFGLNDEHEIAVLELAMRARGEIRRLAEIARPGIALITNIGLSHIGILGSRQAIAEAKSEVLELLPADGRAILNADDSYFDFLRERSPAPVLSFGIERPADFAAKEIEATETPGVRFVMETPAGAVLMELAVPGRHNVLNALSAAAVGLSLGLSLAEIREGLERFAPGGMRMEILRVGDVRILSDCYNASPASMAGALEVLRELPGALRRIAVLGDMKELGREAEAAHREVGAKAAASADWLMTLGELGEMIADGARAAGMADESILSFDENAEAVGALVETLQSGDAVLVKGSRAMRMEEIVRGIGGS